MLSQVKEIKKKKKTEITSNYKLLSYRKSS